MSENPKEPALDFAEEIAKLEERLQYKYPLILSDICYITIKRMIHSQETNKWFNKIAAVKTDGVAPITSTAGNPLMNKAMDIDDKGVL